MSWFNFELCIILWREVNEIFLLNNKTRNIKHVYKEAVDDLKIIVNIILKVNKKIYEITINKRVFSLIIYKNV